jgi:HEXXH motif-containing protein
VTAAHRIADADLDLLATGAGTASTVAALRPGQYSKHALLLRLVVREAQRHSGASRAVRVADSFDLLARVQARTPEVVASVLLHPQVGAWAAHCLRRLRSSAVPSPTLASDLAHVGAIAACAAVRGGQAFEIDVPVRDGMVMLPTLGTARLAPPGVHGVATVRRTVEGGAVDVIGAGATVVLPEDLRCDGVRWRALRRLGAVDNGRRIEVHLDDCDPFRDCHRLGAATLLDDAAIGGWRRHFADAWSVLSRHHTSYADTIATGLTCVVPLESAGSHRGRSASSTDAFGAVAVSRASDGVLLAASLVHEFQHAKLGAVLDLLPFLRPGEESRYYAPWRDDPRPLGGLLQGAYAYLGVTDFWRVQRMVGDRGDARGHFEFARWRDQTRRVVQLLASSARLTDPGRRFVLGVLATLNGWRAERVPTIPLALARAAAADHWLCWRLRNLRVDSAGIQGQVAAWLAGRPRPSLRRLATSMAVPTPAPGDDPRLRLAYVRLAYPRRFGQIVAGTPADLAEMDATRADISCVRGDYVSAAKSYILEITEDPGSLSAWAGLTLVSSRIAPGRATNFMRTRPEVVFAVYQAIFAAKGTAPDPIALATWLGAPSSP